MKIPIIAPSLLSADFGNLQRDIEMINDSQADWFHVDVMDGIFVPNISFGFPIMKTISKHAKKPLDVHLMIANPEKYAKRFAEEGADQLTFHIENTCNAKELLVHIRELKMKAGIAINPGTPIEKLKGLMHFLDLVIVMSVEPGFGGQKFMPQTFHKISELKQLMHAEGAHPLIEVDGGVDLENAGQLFAKGADALVAGNTIFAALDQQAMIHRLKSIQAE